MKTIAILLSKVHVHVHVAAQYIIHGLNTSVFVLKVL